MNPAICSLFEGDYHLGLGALVNSLYQHGFRGVVWVGYRGPLPPWATPLKAGLEFFQCQVAPDCHLRFLPVSTERHLTNYKPEFMLRIWGDYSPEADMLFYFDPDIVIKCRWSFYEEWANHGVALCEDVNSPMTASHPIRMAWCRFFEQRGLRLRPKTDLYLNAGFIGVARKYAGFLREWEQVQELISATADGLRKWNLHDRTFPFSKTDQDALNIALMASELPASLIGKEGMDFAPGGYTMSHALGPLKPWRKRVIREVLLRGRRPSPADRNYWKYTEAPIRLYSRRLVWRRRIALSVAAALGRLVG